MSVNLDRLLGGQFLVHHPDCSRVGGECPCGRDRLVNDCRKDIDGLQDAVRNARKELNEAIREEQRAARDSYAEGRWDEREEQRAW